MTYDEYIVQQKQAIDAERSPDGNNRAPAAKNGRKTVSAPLKRDKRVSVCKRTLRRREIAPKANKKTAGPKDLPFFIISSPVLRPALR